MLRSITPTDLAGLDWIDEGEDGFRLAAELTCVRCGAYQAADSDPSFDRTRPIELAVRLFHAVGWRAEAGGGPVCPDCAART